MKKEKERKRKKEKIRTRYNRFKRRTMTKTVKTDDISLGVDKEIEQIKELMQYYINLPVNHMTSEGKTALDAVELNSASDDIQEQMRSLLREHNGFTGEEIRKMKQYILEH